MTPDELRAIRDAATPGPWTHDMGPDADWGIVSLRGGRYFEASHDFMHRDAALIALAPDLASLLADLMDYTNALIEGEWGFYPTLEKSFDDHRPLLARFQALGDKS